MLIGPDDCGQQAQRAYRETLLCGRFQHGPIPLQLIKLESKPLLYIDTLLHSLTTWSIAKADKAIEGPKNAFKREETYAEVSTCSD
jgi:hypothetical protein